jgi:hypothetical protein
MPFWVVEVQLRMQVRTWRTVSSQNARLRLSRSQGVAGVAAARTHTGESAGVNAQSAAHRSNNGIQWREIYNPANRLKLPWSWKIESSYEALYYSTPYLAIHNHSLVQCAMIALLRGRDYIANLIRLFAVISASHQVFSRLHHQSLSSSLSPYIPTVSRSQHAIPSRIGKWD